MMKHKYDKDEIPPRDRGDDNADDNNSRLADTTDNSKVWLENDGTTEEGFWWDNTNSAGGLDEGFVNSQSGLGQGLQPDTRNNYGLSGKGGATSSMIRQGVLTLRNNVNLD